jgi:competence protein ComEC
LPPIVASLTAFAIGIAVLQTRAELPVPAWGPLAAAGLLLACCIQWRRRIAGRVTVVAVLAAFAMAGFGYAALRAQLRLADALPIDWELQDIAIVGIVDDLPRRSAHGVRFAFAVERVETAGAHVPARISLAWQRRPDTARTRGPAGTGDTTAVAADDATGLVPRVRAGERWSLLVRLRRPHGNVNPGGFDLEAWLLERNLRATGYVREDERNGRIDVFAGRPLDYVQRARERVRDRIAMALPQAPHAQVLVALAIGDQSGLDERQWTVFNRTGTGHLISISGLHVTVFAVLAGGLAFALARRSSWLTSRVPARKVAAVIGLAASFGYVLLAGAEVPAQRTLMMLAVSAIGLWLGRPGSGLVVWAWALVAVLLWDPWAVLAPGFWLSFFAVGLLIYASAGRRGAARPAGVHRRFAHALAEAARGQWAITLGLVPLSLALFQQVSIVGPLANAIAIPVVTFAIVPLALIAAAMPFAAPWQLAHAVLQPLMQCLEALAALPGAAWAQHQPPAWAVASGVAGVALCLAPRGVPGRFLGLFGLAPLLASFPAPPAAGTFRMTVLDVGQGTAAVVQTRRHALLYDTGPRWTDTADAGGRIVVPYLRAAGIRHLDAMIVSHRDLDHSGGALSVMQAVPVGWMATSLDERHEILERHAERGLHLRCGVHQRWEWDGVRFELLFPETAHYADRFRKPNDLSCVLRVSAGDASALFAGDIESVSEIELVASRRETLASDVLVVPHHGSRTSSTSSFVDAVAPRHAVFTVGRRNRFGHPRADVVERYVARHATVHRTDESGALTFLVTPTGPGPPAAAREAAPRYWHVAPSMSQHRMEAAPAIRRAP